jgi:hypothetical protein
VTMKVRVLFSFMTERRPTAWSEDMLAETLSLGWWERCYGLDVITVVQRLRREIKRGFMNI